jgi:hypothetical protein
MYLYNRRKAFRGGGGGTSWPSAYDGDLVRYLRMEEASGNLYDEISATNMTVGGSPTYQQTGIENYGIDFGTSARCLLGSELNGATSAAWSWWANTTTVSSTSYFYINLGGSTIQIYHNATQIVTDFAGFNLFGTKPTNGWHHFVILYNGTDGTAEMYIDGTLEDDTPSATPAASLSTSTESIGHTSSSADCVMDEFGLWKNVTFTDAAAKLAFAQDIYNSGTGTFYA